MPLEPQTVKPHLSSEAQMGRCLLKESKWKNSALNIPKFGYNSKYLLYKYGIWTVKI